MNGQGTSHLMMGSFMESVNDSESCSLVPREIALTRLGHCAFLFFCDSKCVLGGTSSGTACSHENHFDRSEKDLLADVILNLSSKTLTL